ncbi:MAG: SpvB/TcaC N-terminal domain-containing protein [Candidatus Binatia bacterium]
MAHHVRFVRVLAACVASLMVWVCPAPADTTTSLGTRNGEGSTPFTGLAQTPEANLFTGASGTSIKIEVPPGRKNMTPQLVLGYSSGGGPSPYGFGWDLPLGRIQRSTKWGVPRPCAGAHTDDFVLVLPSGTVELASEPADGANAYRPKIEESWLQATKNTGGNQWVAYDRSGIKYVFGDVASARVGNDTSVFQATDPNGYCRFTSIWGLTRIEDTNGGFR